MIAAGYSDMGRVREVNQDSYRYEVVSEELAWAVVCDGMGGANGGSVASELAVEVIAGQLRRAAESTLTLKSARLVLESAIAAANSKVYDAAQSDETLSGMGTTVVAVLVLGNEAAIAYAGDSRIYHIHGGIASQVSKDHSVVQVLVDDGKITQEEAKHHPQRRYITKALGVEPQLSPDHREAALEAGDLLLLCSDGFSNYVENEEIGLLCESIPVHRAAQRLVEIANERGGADNITAVVLAAQPIL